jgi:hypothetical protein
MCLQLVFWGDGVYFSFSALVLWKSKKEMSFTDFQHGSNWKQKMPSFVIVFHVNQFILIVTESENHTHKKIIEPPTLEYWFIIICNENYPQFVK